MPENPTTFILAYAGTYQKNTGGYTEENSQVTPEIFRKIYVNSTAQVDISSVNNNSINHNHILHYDLRSRINFYEKR